jgi:hypothetical protein
MLERLLEIRFFVSALCASDEFQRHTTNLNDNQWRLASSLVEVLKPIRSVTKAVQKNTAPVMNELLLQLSVCREQIEKCARPVPDGGAYGVHTFSTVLLQSFEQRITIPCNAMLEAIVGSFLCPNIKGVNLSEEQDQYAKQKCRDFLSARQEPPQPLAPPVNQQQQGGNFLSNKILALRAAKANVQVVGPDPENAVAVALKVNMELGAWEATAPHGTGTEKVLQFWATQTHLSNLQKLAKRVLSRPAASAESERTFSKTGLIYTDLRTQLKPDHANWLVMIASALRANQYKLKY